MDGDLCPFCEGQEAIAGRELLAWRPPGRRATAAAGRCASSPIASRRCASRATLGEPADPLFQSLGGLGAHEVIIESPDHRRDLGDDERGAGAAGAVGVARADARSAARHPPQELPRSSRTSARGRRDARSSALAAARAAARAAASGGRDRGRARASRAARRAVCSATSSSARSRPASASSPATTTTMAFAPFASRVPFETLGAAAAARPSFEELTDEALLAVAERLRDVMRRLDAALAPPPYRAAALRRRWGRTTARRITGTSRSSRG